MCLVLTVALACFGLVAVSGTATAAPLPPVQTCTPDINNCTPPGLLNDTMLSAPSPDNLYYATTAQRASLGSLQNEAVSNTLADHGLPASDRSAVQSWGRSDALAELWALIVQAIRIDAGQRSADQQNVVDWLTAVMHRRAQVAADNAGWEFLKWAGDVGATDPVPDQNTLVSRLNQFAAGTLTPANFNAGTPANSTSGFCVYTPPAPYQTEYTGNLSTPPDQNTAAGWCYPPTYQCSSLTGCNNNQPSFDQFVKWGEADVAGSRNEDTGLAVLGAQVASSLEAAAAGVGAGVAGGAIATALGPVMTGTGFQTLLFPYLARPLVRVAGALSEELVAELAGDLVANAVGAVVTAVIAVIAIAVIVGIQVTQNAAEAGQLSSLITNAATGTPDLQKMLNDPSKLGGLFGMFIQAALPDPTPTACDNSAGDPVVLNLNGTASPPCLNAPAIPASAGTDPQFLITPQNSAQSTRSDTVSWTDATQEVAAANSVGLDSQPISVTQDTTRLAGNWFVTRATFPNGDVSPDGQSLSMHYVDWNAQEQTAWLRRNDDGSYSFLVAAGHTIFHPYPETVTVDPNSCLAQKMCTVSNSLQLAYSSSPTDPNVPTQRFTVQVVPAAQPSVSVTLPGSLTEGSPATMTASATGGADGGYSYQWYLQSTGNMISCTIGSPYCGFDGPYTGASINHVFQAAGALKGILLATDSGGRSFEKDFTVPVGDVPPTLNLGSNDAYWISFGSRTTVTGVVAHTGSDDAETLRIDWGDGSSDDVTMQPNGVLNLNLTYAAPAAGEYDFTGTHTYAHAGEYTIIVTVTDEAGGTARGTESWKVMTADTTTDLTSSANPVLTGQQLTYTATVTTPVAGAPTGTVAFTDAGDPITGCTAAPVDANGAATCQVSYTVPGSHTVTAKYSGDTDFTGSASPALTQTVQGATTTTLAAAPNPALASQPVTLTATVFPAPGGGTVAFRDAGSPIAGCGAAPISGSTATCQITDLTVGTHPLTAVYSGDTDYQTSTSNTVVTETVIPDSPANLADLTLQYIQSSAKFNALNPAQQQRITAAVQNVGAALEQITSRLTQTQIAHLVTGYKDAVAGLQAGGWLTVDQATTLDNLADHVQP